MKTTKRYLLLLMSVVLVGISACKKNTDDDDDDGNTELPDAVFSADISGEFSRHLEFTLPGNTSTPDGKAITASQNDNLNLLLMTVLGGSENWQLAVGVNAGSVSTGTYQLNQTQTSFGSFNDLSTGEGYMSTSGSMTISKAELFQNVGGNIGAYDTYFCDGTFSMQLTHSSDTSKHITVDGSFSGINVSDD